MNDHKVNAIVQARMGSTRLPGKVLMELEGISILDHIINRLHSVSEIRKVIVATSTEQDDDHIYQFCKARGIDCVRGSENNVLSRFGMAARLYPADDYIRATGDNPMIDTCLVRNMLCFFRDNNLTYSCYKNYPLGSGVEIFTHEALEESLIKADKLYELEHVTPYMYQRMQNRKVEYYVSKEDDSQLRLTIDTEKDFLFAKELFSRLYKKNPFFGIADIKHLLEEHPSLKCINADIHQKILGE